MTRPRYMIMIRSLMYLMMPRSWEIKTYVRLNCFCRRRKRLMTCAWIETSRADTGSSQTMIFGSMERARAMFTRCLWPPENSWG